MTIKKAIADEIREIEIKNDLRLNMRLLEKYKEVSIGKDTTARHRPVGLVSKAK